MKKLPRRFAEAIGIPLTICAFAGFFLIAWFDAPSLEKAVGWPVFAIICVAAAIAQVFLRFSYVIHELGHLLFGLCAGLRVGQVRVGWLCFDGAGVKIAVGKKQAGETQFALKRARGAHARLFTAALGGPLSGLLVGAALLALWFVLAPHPAMLFFALLAPFVLAEGLFELLPAELASGKTDGLVLAELVRKTGETEIAVRVMQAQCLCAQGGIGCAERALLFDVPVVREDSPVFSELLRLQEQFLRDKGDTAGAERIAARICAIEAETADAVKAQESNAGSGNQSS